MKRVFIVVLDGFGIGELPDAEKYGDCGSNTLGAVRSNAEFYCPNLEKLGLFDIDGVGGGKGKFLAALARMKERSVGKDTTAGHWEIAGLVTKTAFPTYSNGFPEEIISAFEKTTGRKVLCNLPYSGTEVIKDYGKEHLKTGGLIVYTSADSVFQIAAHEKIVSVNELYFYCEKAREILQGKHGVGRVIARPFFGEYPFIRSKKRRDFSLSPSADTMLDLIQKAGLSCIGVGKIEDIFAGKGLTESIHTKDNDGGMSALKSIVKRDFSGLCFVNLVDFDAVYGHRNDVAGYARALSAFDFQLGEILPLLRADDLLILTADHGCDPSTPSTDHSREYTPMLAVGEKFKAVNLGARESFADISATVLEYLGVEKERTAGESFLKEILK